MPPKPKFTKDEIIDAAFQIAREEGIENVVAREVGKRLGTSASPIFTVWESMDGLKEEVRRKASALFSERTSSALEYTPAFKEFGIRMIRFAKDEPKLFRVLFLQESGKVRTFDELVPYLGDFMGICLSIIENDYGLSEEYAKILFGQVFIFTLGMSTLIANGVCEFTEEEILSFLGREFVGTMMLINSGGMKMCDIVPTKNGNGGNDGP